MHLENSISGSYSVVNVLHLHSAEFAGSGKFGGSEAVRRRNGAAF